MAIDSILPAPNTNTTTTNSNEDIPPLRPISNAVVTSDGAEIISTFEVVASGSGQANLQTLKPIQNKVHIGPTSKSQIGAPPPNITQKVKFVPSNQFVHIKPPPLNTQKIYMKTPKGAVNAAQPITFRVAPSADAKGAPITNKLITVKGKGVGQQILTATSYDNRLVQQQRLATPQVSGATTVVSSAGAKFAIIKQGPGGQTIQTHIQGQIHGPVQQQIPQQLHGQIALQHQTPITASIQSQMQTTGQLQPQQIQIQGQMGKVQTTLTHSMPQSSAVTTVTRQDIQDLNTSILDLPILFADSDGNIESITTSEQATKETTTVYTTPSAPSTGNYIVIASTQAGGIKPTLIQNHRPMMVNSISPSNSLTKVTTTSQNSKFVVINRSNLNQLKPAGGNTMTSRSITPIKYSKMVLPTSDIITSVAGKTITNTSTLAPGTKIDISSLMKSGTVTTKGGAPGMVTTTATGKPIIINESDKSAFKNVIKIPSSEVPQLKATSTPSNSIVLKQGDLRTVGSVGAMPVLKGGILNRNITVRKINIIRQPTITAVTVAPATVTSTTMATSYGSQLEPPGGAE